MLVFKIANAHRPAGEISNKLQKDIKNHKSIERVISLKSKEKNIFSSFPQKLYVMMRFLVLPLLFRF